MKFETNRLGGHNALGLNQLDGHLGALARILSLGTTFEPEGEGLGGGEAEPKRRSRARDDDDDDLDDPVENDTGTRWRKPSSYEIRLRKESAKWRNKYQMEREEKETAATKAKQDSDAALAALKAQYETDKQAAKTAAGDALTAAKKESDQRFIRFHIKAALKAAECQNVDDALKLIDGSAIQISDEGDVEGVDALVEQLKKDKAYLFTAPTTTTTSEAPKPKPGEPQTKTAADMTPEEYEAARAAMTGSSSRRRRSA